MDTPPREAEVSRKEWGLLGVAASLCVIGMAIESWVLPYFGGMIVGYQMHKNNWAGLTGAGDPNG